MLVCKFHMQQGIRNVADADSKSPPANRIILSVTNNNDFWIRWLGVLALLYNYIHTLNSCRTSPTEESLTAWICLSLSLMLRQTVSWCRGPSGAHDQIFITVWHLLSSFCGAPFLTRRPVCLLYMLLALASAVFLGSESLGTRDHILLSQIWDFHFRRLLPLARSRWRYSTPPPHGGHGISSLIHE
jgi:hypothetical protein